MTAEMTAEKTGNTAAICRQLFPDEAGIAEAAALLQAGQLVAFATETVYGLGADATQDHAVAAIFAAKRRPTFNPLIVHVAELEAAQRLGQFDEVARALAKAFWPGPLTLVVPRREDAPLSRLVSAGLDTVALRVPNHPAALRLLRAAGRPVAAPSANRSGQLTATSAAHVRDSLGDRVAAVLDCGPCTVGVESTVIGLGQGAPALLRPGGLAVADIEALTGPLQRPEQDPMAPRSPGQTERHYAPLTPLRLNSREAGPDEVLIGFGPEAPPGTLNLSPQGDLVEAAARLFELLHQADQQKAHCIAVMPVPDWGLGEAINDRLRRAAKSLEPRP